MSRTECSTMAPARSLREKLWRPISSHLQQACTGQAYIALTRRVWRRQFGSQCDWWTKQRKFKKEQTNEQKVLLSHSVLPFATPKWSLRLGGIKQCRHAQGPKTPSSVWPAKGIMGFALLLRRRWM